MRQLYDMKIKLEFEFLRELQYKIQCIANFLDMYSEQKKSVLVSERHVDEQLFHTIYGLELVSVSPSNSVRYRFPADYLNLVASVKGTEDATRFYPDYNDFRFHPDTTHFVVLGEMNEQKTYRPSEIGVQHKLPIRNIDLTQIQEDEFDAYAFQYSTFMSDEEVAMYILTCSLGCKNGLSNGISLCVYNIDNMLEHLNTAKAYTQVEYDAYRYGSYDR